jgi:hypothetical protein
VADAAGGGSDECPGHGGRGVVVVVVVVTVKKTMERGEERGEGGRKGLLLRINGYHYK